ncbi:SAM-dependent methyltransferase [Sphaerisporangium fuscum]|uniref:SAM-dependent methyltransferase n=1 Tax=Sphaerisporangium fuscum TaxID=2835868 RepID=UPI001BDD0A59|nr:SAM-dependent methyltransferase [Sphaerisporangium fuscum]
MSALPPGGIDVHTPNPARIYDYMLGGKDNFAADREAAKRVLKVFPESREGARRNREFLGNAVRHLAAEVGIRQFVDIGAGLPTQDNVHQVAHSVAPDARTVYVDNDPVVCVHGRALLANTDTVAMVNGDVRKPEDLHAKVAQTGLIDWSRPVGMLMVALLHYVEEPYEHVARLREYLAPGSHLVITHLTVDGSRAGDKERLRQIYAESGTPLIPRTVEEIGSLFGDFELLDGVPFLPPHLAERLRPLGAGGVARKP